MRVISDSWRVRGVSAAIFGAALVLLFGGTLLGETRHPRDRPNDKPPRFTVELRLEEAGIQGFFLECEGLSSESEVVEFRDGNDPNTVRKLPGRTTYSNLILRRGMMRDTSLWQWRRLVETGNIEEARANGTLVLLDRGNPVATWGFVRAWPVKVSGPELNGDGNEIAIETIEIAHEGLTLN